MITGWGQPRGSPMMRSSTTAARIRQSNVNDNGSAMVGLAGLQRRPRCLINGLAQLTPQTGTGAGIRRRLPTLGGGDSQAVGGGAAGRCAAMGLERSEE